MAAALFSVATGANAAAPELEEVLVTATSLEETLPIDLAKYGSDLAVITGETIRNAGYVDTAQALQMQTPGLYIVPRNGPFSYVDLSLQGSRTGDVLWTVDGVRINNRLYTSTSPADTLPASMIERIEVLKGGQSLFYGTQAAAGVINVVTRGFSDKTGGELSFGGDTTNGAHLNGYVRGAVGPHKLVAYASKDEARGFDAFDAFQPSATARKRGYDVISAGVKYGIDISDSLTARLQYQHTDATLDYPGARLTAKSYNHRDEEIASAQLDYKPSETAQFFLKAYLHDWDSDYTTINNDPLVPGRQVTVDNKTYWGYLDYGVSALAKLRLHKGFEYQLGYDFQNFNGRDEVLLIEQKTEVVHAAIAQIRTTEEMFENARFAAGVRYNVTEGANTTVWNVSGRYDVSPALYVEGVAGTSFVLPSAEQLFGNDPCCAVGNRDLEPEKSQNLNLSAGGVLDRFSWQVTGFARKIDNLITDTYDLPAYPDGIYVNADSEVRVSGGEFTAGLNLSDALSISANYTYTRSRLRGSDTQIERIPEHTAKAVISYGPKDRPYGAGAAVNWVGDNYSTVTGFGRQNYGDYVVVDLSAHIYLDGQERHHKLAARLENAFDEAYATRVASAVRDNAPGRFLYHNRGVPRVFHLTYSLSF